MAYHTGYHIACILDSGSDFFDPLRKTQANLRLSLPRLEIISLDAGMKAILETMRD
jgi:hypothetical protein